MRLSSAETGSIKTAVVRIAGPRARLRLVGARGDGTRRDPALTAQMAATLRMSPDLGERVDAFVARPSRRQDGLADKRLPARWQALAEAVGPPLDNLNRAERLGRIAPSETWMACRQRGIKLIRASIRDAALLADGLNSARRAVPMLLRATEQIVREACSRLTPPTTQSNPT